MNRHTVFVFAPSASMAVMPADMRSLGIARLGTLGFDVVIGDHVDCTRFHTAGTVQERLADFRTALACEDVDLVMAAFGGYNSNQLLQGLEFQEIELSGKRFIGFSDVVAMLLPISQRSQAMAFHGPSFSVFCDPGISEYTVDGFVRTLRGEVVSYSSSSVIADDKWWLKNGYGPREWVQFDGWKVYREGEARGKILGGNLETLCSLAGTPFVPSFRDRILFIEDATGTRPGAFHRDLTHLLHMGVIDDIVGLAIGAPPRGSALAEPGCLDYILADVVGSATDMPVLYDVNCSHVDPMMTIPLEREAILRACRDPAIEVNVDLPSECI